MWSYGMGWRSGVGACRRRVTLLWKLSIGQSSAPPLYEQREYIGHNHTTLPYLAILRLDFSDNIAIITDTVSSVQVLYNDPP